MISNELRSILQKTCAALNKHKVEYILIGGTAVAFYGYQRPSGGLHGNLDMKYDVDFWYKPTATNYYNLLKALKALDIDTSRLENLIFDPQKTFLRIPHESFRTEFLPQVKGLSSFNKSKQSSKVVNLDGNEISIISYRDLILNKKSIDREVDRSDIEQLEKRNKGLST
ncbi:nucleotidyltransferase [Fulvivirgaceae bacterium BMA12]|uniref:Nucleotidyltransferase n=1 Tax=Agaribacillus aureus TaxID=3051825 RepID=A0ABT8LAM4_9BACT|nr:nucleotidyltransferase [Fulvivirgaceae bacterium BMA12]